MRLTWSLTPKISCTTTMPPRGLPFGSATYASSSWPSFALSLIIFPMRLPQKRGHSAFRHCSARSPESALREKRNVPVSLSASRPRKAECPRLLLRLRAAREPAEVLRDRVLVPLRDLRGRLRAHRGALALVAARDELELDLVGEVEELLQFGGYELGVPAEPRAQRF